MLLYYFLFVFLLEVRVHCSAMPVRFPNKTQPPPEVLSSLSMTVTMILLIIIIEIERVGRYYINGYCRN